jgi:hypothetical protein
MVQENLEEEFLEDSKWKKIFVKVSSIFLLLLILSYFLVSYPLFPILESIFESETSKENKIVVGNLSVDFNEASYLAVQELYKQDQSVEFAACLTGKKEFNAYSISEVYQPEIIEQTFNHVSFKSCDKNTLILLHSHPYRRCIASEQDLITLNRTKQNNPDILMVIMCEPNRFSIYQ